MPAVREQLARRGVLTGALALAYLALPCEAQCNALSIPVDTTKWLGYDGSWSPVTLNLGTPVQAVDLFPSTAGQETIVIGVDGCDGTIQCESLRGGVFASNESSTFEAGAGYDVGLDHDLGYSGAGYYGLDDISINGAVTLKDQMVAIVNSTQYWTGYLGLGPSNTTFGTVTTSSFLGAMMDGAEPQIPSLSYAYTAGASYRLKQVPASLTLGGYDANRFEANDATFSLNSNQQPVLAINSIIMSGPDGGNQTMLDQDEQDLFTIDSTTPFLWLPETVAEKLGTSLGLVYNDTLNLFLYPNSSVYESLASSDLSFSFTFADTPGKPDTLSLTVIGQAFTSLNLSYGFPGLDETSTAEPIPYFPVRKAANSTQYIVGRAFLQEAYLIVDYTRNNFSLSQATFSDNAIEEIALVDIKAPENYSSEDTDSSSSSSMTTGTIVGIAVGVVVILTLVICSVAICLMRRHFAKQVVIHHAEDPPPPPRSGIAKLILGEQRVAELPAREFVPEDKPESVDGDAKDYYAADKKMLSEVSDTQIRELPAPWATAAIELQGSPVVTPYAPAELPDRSSGDSIWRSPFGPASASTTEGAGTGTFLSVSGMGSSSDGRPSPTTPMELSSASTRSGSAKSYTSLVSKFSPESEGSRRPSAQAGASDQRASRSSKLGAPDRSEARYTIDDSVKRAFDPRQLRDAPKATRRKFSFEEGSQ